MSPSSTPQPREAILLVAGLGARLQPLTDDRPKCLLTVGDEPLLRRLLSQLATTGIDRVVLATGYRADLLVDTVRSWDLPLAISTAHCDTFHTDNNAVSLGCALPELTEPRFLLCDGDVLIRDPDLFERLLTTPGDNVLTITRFPELGHEEMKAHLDDHGAILALSKKLPPHRAHGESLGIQKIGPSAFDALRRRLSALSPDERRRLYYEDVFSELIQEGIPFAACEIPPGGWTEIDTLEDLEAARTLAMDWESP